MSLFALKFTGDEPVTLPYTNAVPYGSDGSNFAWLVSDGLTPGSLWGLMRTTSDVRYKLAETGGEAIIFALQGYSVTRSPTEANQLVNPSDTAHSEASLEHALHASDDGVISWGPIFGRGIQPATLLQQPGQSSIWDTPYEPARLAIHINNNPDKVTSRGPSIRLNFDDSIPFEEVVYLTVDNLQIENASPYSRRLTWDAAVNLCEIGTPVYRVHRQSSPPISGSWEYDGSTADETISSTDVSGWLTGTEFLDEDFIATSVFYRIEARLDMGESIEGPWRYIGGTGSPIVVYYNPIVNVFPISTANTGNYSNEEAYHPVYVGTVAKPSSAGV